MSDLKAGKASAEFVDCSPVFRHCGTFLVPASIKLLRNEIRVAIAEDTLHSQLLSHMETMEESLILCYVVGSVEVDSKDIVELVTFRRL